MTVSTFGCCHFPLPVLLPLPGWILNSDLAENPFRLPRHSGLLAMKHRFLIFERDSTSYHCELICEGIRRYFSRGEHLLTFLPVGASELEGIYQTQVEIRPVILGWLERSSSIAYFDRLGVPFLNLRESDLQSNTGLSAGFHGEGSVAADFFIKELNLESLAFVGLQNSASSSRKKKEFEEAAKVHGIPVKSLILESVIATEAGRTEFAFDRERVIRRYADLRNLLESLPKPAGIFCSVDRIALSLYYFAEYLGFSIPADLSILGVGCLQRADVGGVQSISVVHTDYGKLGYHAAELMENYVTGGGGATARILEPDGIIHRSTTSRRGVRDVIVRKAYDLIEKQPNVTVAELCALMSIPRRTLENHFVAATNLSVGKAIDQERFQRAKQLLRSRKFSHQAIAGLAGYRNHRQMIRSFDRFLKMSPAHYVRTYIDPASD